MTDLRAAAQAALEALEGFDRFRRIMTDGPDTSDKLLAEDYAEMAFVKSSLTVPMLRTALAEQPEPVATVTNVVGADVRIHWFGGLPQIGDKLYTHQQPEPVRLTDEEVQAAVRSAGTEEFGWAIRVARAVEAAVLAANGRTG